MHPDDQHILAEDERYNELLTRAINDPLNIPLIREMLEDSITDEQASELVMIQIEKELQE